MNGYRKETNLELGLYECRYEIVRNGKRFFYTCHLVSTFPEMCKKWLESVLGEVDVCVSVKLFDINGITDEIVEKVCDDNTERYLKKKELMKEMNSQHPLSQGIIPNYEEKLELIPRIKKMIRWNT
jgi:hypothetical protein